MLCGMVTNAWLPEDQWLVARGKWIDPRKVSPCCRMHLDDDLYAHTGTGTSVVTCGVLTHTAPLGDTWQVGLAANAFFDTISSKKQVGIARRVRATPTDSLLNRAKLAQTKRGLVGKALAKLDPMRLVGGAGSRLGFPTVIADPTDTTGEEDAMAKVIQRATRHRSKMRKSKQKPASPVPSMASPAGTMLPPILTDSPKGNALPPIVPHALPPSPGVGS